MTEESEASVRDPKFLLIVLIWAMSILLAAFIRPTWLVEGTSNHLNFEFPSKEAYVMTVQIVQAARIVYFVALAFLTFHLLRRQNHWQ